MLPPKDTEGLHPVPRHAWPGKEVQLVNAKGLNT